MTHDEMHASLRFDKLCRAAGVMKNVKYMRMSRKSLQQLGNKDIKEANETFNNPEPPTDFGVKKDGTIVQIGESNDKPDRLFVLDENNQKVDLNKDGKITKMDYFKLLDKSVIPTLLSTDPTFKVKETGVVEQSIKTYNRRTKKWTKKIISGPELYQGHYTFLRSRTIAKRLFEFLAANSRVEWELEGYKGGLWMVGTIHQNAQAPDFDDLYVRYFKGKRKDQFYEAHSHPDADPEIDFKPSNPDITAARSFRRLNPRARSWLYMPKNPKRKWMEIR